MLLLVVVGDIIDIVKNPKSKAMFNKGSLKDAKDCLNKIFDKLSHVVVESIQKKAFMVSL